MTNVSDTEDDIDDSEEDFDEGWHILGQDKWENTDFVKGVNEKYPGWYLIKMQRYSSNNMSEVKDWLKDDNVKYGKYEVIGWGGTCSYSVGVIFESPRDAMIFKLRWI